MAMWVLLGLLLAVLLIAKPEPLVVELEEGVGPVEWGVYLKTSEGLYKAAVVYLPAYYEVAFPDNTTGKAPFYQPWRFAVLPLERVNKTGNIVGRIITDQGTILFVDEPPVIIFAKEALASKPAKVMAKELPPPRSLAPKPKITTRNLENSESKDQAARPESTSVAVGAALEPVGALYLAGQARNNQYLRVYKADPYVSPPCGDDYVYLGKNVRHAALGILPRDWAQGRVVVELYNVAGCSLIGTYSITVPPGGDYIFAYFILFSKFGGRDVSNTELAARFKFEGSGAISANVSIAYNRVVAANFQTSTYDLRQYGTISSSQYFYGVLHAPHIPPDGLSDMNIDINVVLYTVDVANGVCQYKQLKYEVYINNAYEGGGYLPCNTESSSCKCSGAITLSYSSAPFPLRSAKGAGRGALAVALIFKRPDSSTPPRIYLYTASQRISGNFWREIYTPYALSWEHLQQFALAHIINREATNIAVVAKSTGTSMSGNWNLGLELGVGGPNIKRVDWINVRFRHNMAGRLSNIPYRLYYAMGDAIKPVSAPWWQELGAAAADVISLVITIIPMGYSTRVLAGLLTYAAGKFINAATGQVVTYGDSSTFYVEWWRGWSEPTPNYVVINLYMGYQGSDVNLNTEYITFASNRGIESYPAYSGGAVPRYWGSIGETMTWWSFRGLAHYTTWNPR